MMALLIFYFLIVLAAASAFSILLVKNILHAVLLLLVCLLSIAGLYVLMSAEFLAVTQILIYAGGVVVIILFGVMITRRISKPMSAGTQNRWMGYLTGGALLLSLLYCFSDLHIQTATYETGIKPIGFSLMTDYAMPFELAGIMLLVSLIGAAVTAGSSHKK